MFKWLHASKSNRTSEKSKKECEGLRRFVAWADSEIYRILLPRSVTRVLLMQLVQYDKIKTFTLLTLSLGMSCKKSGLALHNLMSYKV